MGLRKRPAPERRHAAKTGEVMRLEEVVARRKAKTADAERKLEQARTRAAVAPVVA